ncbi:MAG: UDP-2,3-diacylglucosamine diphosphatase [Proteobacteria bacterium]|nr:UDP-2,3-diacylglucosamine diphosphatase [Pseudomonadota bacterium]
MDKIIFLADAHLKKVTDDEYRDLLKFFEIIEKDSNEIKAVFILGDLFDFFIAFPQVVFYEHLPLLSVMQRVVEKGIKIFYFEGNHDFFLKKLNLLGYPIEIIEGDMTIDLNGKFFLSHGDLLNSKDYSHKILSLLVRNPVTYLLAYVLPPYLVYHFAHWFSKFSRENISGKQKLDDKIFFDVAPLLAKRGYLGAILGHFHIAKKLEIGPKFNFYLLGSWKIDRSYLVYDGKNKILEYKKFNRFQEHL